MRNIIAGTAGHIDHGKTALVRALTGIDTDRWEEEKRRGITIDLGFAHLVIPPKWKIGFVDVPGHERFVKNMLAGVGGIDLVLLVIAADESIKPQTREHFDICRLLGIRHGIVVLTKKDAVDGELLALAQMEAEEFVAGSFLEGAPMVAVSSITGEGLDELKAAIATVAEKIPARSTDGYFRLPVDRSFAIKGFGTVVTGTLQQGVIAREEEVEVHPLGRRLRVRGVQVHGEQVDRAEAGERTALNLAGADWTELHRGMVLTRPGLFQPVSRFDAMLNLLPDAKNLQTGAPVHFHAGSAEIEAEVRLLGGKRVLRAGEQSWTRFELRDPALLLPGDRFIIRRFSPVITIGGGVVLDIAPPRYRRRQDAGARLEVLAKGSAAERIALLAGESAWGMGLDLLAARTGLSADAIREAAGKAAGLVSLQMPGQRDNPWFAPKARIAEWTAGIRKQLEKFHRAQPLEPGLSKEELRSREMPDAPPFLVDHVLATAGLFVVEGSTVRLKTHETRLEQDEEQARAAIEGAFRQSGLTVPPLQQVLSGSGVDPKRARTLLQMLLRENRVVRVSDELYFHRSAIDSLLSTLAGHKGEQFGVAEFKDWTGLSRKYAIPLLEFLDRERVTRRAGEHRIVV